MKSTAAKPNPDLPKMALASVVLGALGLALSNLLLGGVLAIVGLMLGIVHIGLNAKSKPLAWTGIGLSAAALLVGARLAMNPPPNPFANWIGVPAPDFSVGTLDGRRVTLSEFRGRRVILNFWSTTCPPCVAEIPDLEKLHRAASNEVVVIGLTLDKPDALRRFIKRNEMTYSVATNIALPRPFADVRLMPTTFFIDRKGVIQDIVEGQLTFEQFQNAAVAPDYQGQIKPEPGSMKSL